MTGSERGLWAVGGVSRGDAGWRITKARELSADMFAELDRKIALVAGLASQKDYGRLLGAVSRLDVLLATARDELEREGRLSPRSAAALPLDLASVAEASRRLEATLSEGVDAAALPRQIVAAFHGVRGGIRASPSYLVAHEIARRADEVKVVLRDGVLHFEGGARSGATDIARALLGLSFSLVVAYLEAFRDRFEEVATELEDHAAAVTTGTPYLLSYCLSASGPKHIRFKDIPITDIAALRRFYAKRKIAQDPRELVQAAIDLADATHLTDLHLGDVDISLGLVGGGATDQVNNLPTATFELDLQLLGSTPVDYWGVLRYGLTHDGYSQELFAGAVQSVVVQGDRVDVECEGAANLTEHASGGTLASGLADAELIHSLLLLAGLSADALSLESSPSEHAEEEFEVLLPIGGLTVTEPVALGGTEVVPIAVGEAVLEGLPDEGDVASRLRRAFGDADSYGRALVLDATLPGAQEAGISTIEATVAWLVTRARYGFARLPDGRIQSFSRQESLRAPQTGSVVLVRGTTTGRRWLRSRHIDDTPLTRPLEPASMLLDPPLPADLPMEEQHALFALRRATSETILESQLAALWEAIEFYAAGTEVERLFTRAELKRLRESPPDWLNTHQQQRFADVIGKVNAPTLARRVALRLEQDGVPLTPHERDLLFKTLRDARNHPTHGRLSDPPTRAEIHHGISIVARMLVYRVARRDSH